MTTTAEANNVTNFTTQQEKHTVVSQPISSSQSQPIPSIQDEVFEIIPLTHIEERLQLLTEHIKKAIQIIIQKEMLDISRRGELLLLFDAWQFIARCLGLIPGIENCKPLTLNDKIIGWEARAVLRNAKGQVVGAAEAVCTCDEKGKEKMPQNSLKSTAQTRALTKVLKTHLSWVIALVGLPDTEKLPAMKKQIARLQEIVRKNRINTEKVKEIIKRNFNKNNSKELTTKEAAILINILENMTANNKQQKGNK